jgi:hypothetical protein
VKRKFAAIFLSFLVIIFTPIAANAANFDMNFDGTANSGDDYAIRAVCSDPAMVPNLLAEDYAEFCNDYALTATEWNNLNLKYHFWEWTWQFPTAMPGDAVNEGVGLGYYFRNNQCQTAWGTDCLPQMYRHMLANPELSGYSENLSQVQLLGLFLAGFVAIKLITAFALRSGHA